MPKTQQAKEIEAFSKATQSTQKKLKKLEIKIEDLDAAIQTARRTNDEAKARHNQSQRH